MAAGSHTGLRMGSYNKHEVFWHSFVHGQLPPFSMPSKLLISHGEAKFVCFTIGYIPDSRFNYLLVVSWWYPSIWAALNKI